MLTLLCVASYYDRPKCMLAAKMVLVKWRGSAPGPRGCMLDV